MSSLDSLSSLTSSWQISSVSALSHTERSDKTVSQTVPAVRNRQMPVRGTVKTRICSGP